MNLNIQITHWNIYKEFTFLFSSTTLKLYSEHCSILFIISENCFGVFVHFLSNEMENLVLVCFHESVSSLKKALVEKYYRYFTI